MPAYTKADFQAAYRTYPHPPGTNQRIAGYRSADWFDSYASPTVTIGATTLVAIGTHSVTTAHTPVVLLGELNGQTVTVWGSVLSVVANVSVTIDVDSSSLVGVTWLEFRAPNLIGYNMLTGIDKNFVLHYHPLIIKPEAQKRAQLLIDAGLVDANSSLVIVGGAFGWLAEALRVMVPGLAAVTIDLSQYVQDVKGVSPDDELIETIQAIGYDHTVSGSIGEWIFNQFTDPNPRSADIITVLQEDMSNNGSRNRIRAKLPRDCTRIITEEVWQVMDATEQGYVNDASTAWSIPVTHIIGGVLS